MRSTLGRNRAGLGEACVAGRNCRVRPERASALAGASDPASGGRLRSTNCARQETRRIIGVASGILQATGRSRWPFPSAVVLGQSRGNGARHPEPGRGTRSRRHDQKIIEGPVAVDPAQPGVVKSGSQPCGPHAGEIVWTGLAGTLGVIDLVSLAGLDPATSCPPISRFGPEYAPAAITTASASYRPAVASTARTDPFADIHPGPHWC